MTYEGGRCKLQTMRAQRKKPVLILLALASLSLFGLTCAGLPASVAVGKAASPTPTPDPLAIPLLPESPTQVDIGRNLYYYHCMPCHGDQGQGDGTGVANLPSGGPAAFPNDLSDAYIFWRVWEGVPGTIMPPFNWLISESDIWDITAYVQQITATSQGGQ